MSDDCQLEEVEACKTVKMKSNAGATCNYTSPKLHE